MANLASIQIARKVLNDGKSIPLLGFGSGTAYFKGSGSEKIDQRTLDGVKMALKVGYNHLDCAEGYGNEVEMGLAIKESKVPRDKIFVTSKVGNSCPNITEAFKQSLKKLQLDYLDLYLIHWPFWAESDEQLQKAWAEMEALKESGQVKSIGVSNFYVKHLEAILKTAKIKPAVNQVEFHPYLQHRDLAVLMKKHDIALEAYGPLSAITKASPGPLDELLQSLGKKYGVGSGEICLRWCIEQDIIPVTTSGKEQRLTDYLRIFQLRLTPREVEEISELGLQKNYRGFFNNKFAADDFQ